MEIFDVGFIYIQIIIYTCLYFKGKSRTYNIQKGKYQEKLFNEKFTV